jgi:hypothetical protein
VGSILSNSTANSCRGALEKLPRPIAPERIAVIGDWCHTGRWCISPVAYIPIPIQQYIKRPRINKLHL